MRAKWPKCPKCKSQNVRIIEIWSRHTIVWEPGSKNEEGILEMGDPDHVRGVCRNCGKTWRMRGIIQVDLDWWDEPAHDAGKDGEA